MTISDIMQKMIIYSKGNLHDINHFLKVWSFAKTIGEAENTDPDTQFILEAAAITHDIACPLCREKYGNTNGKNQEREGETLVRSFFEGTGLGNEQTDRIAYLVAHHHTPDAVDGVDYQILIEADYLVNADESGYSEDNIKNVCKKIFKTGTGIKLLKAIYGI